ncbi:hypothetical protein [Sphingomonas soli]|uniref:hypothetical protein n=1 Tax=Sphingomonas soli TaxID=266127 RepID=UPI00083604BB|nr:hypothetical protein [Sphingomonas soli]
MAAPDDLALNRAPSQADRVRAAPSPQGVAVDGRDLPTLLAFAGHYGKLITFYDLNDQPHGDWSSFFRNDRSIALAIRAGLDLASIRADFDRLLADLTEAEIAEARIAHGTRAAAAIQQLARIQTLGQIDGDTLGHALTGLSTSDRRDFLAEPARRLQAMLGKNAIEQALDHHHGGWVEQFAEQLDAVASALLTVLDQDRAATLAALDASFDDKRHAPQSGLYDAFAVLFGHAQASINRFPERLIQFYQREVLHQTSRSGTPDTVPLAFTPAKGLSHAELPRGTRFLAGTDGNGESIGYALDSAVSVDIASVASLRTLTVTSQTLDGGTPILAQALSGEVALSEKAPAIAAPFPIFGASTTGVSGVLTTVAASLGFAVASPTLLLAGGTRSVTIGFSLTGKSLAEAWNVCERIGVAAGGVAPGDVFTQLIEAAFALRYSTAGGWVAIEGGYQATEIGPDSGLFVLSFVLDSDADPFVALSATPPAADATPPDGAVPDHDVPVLLGTLRQDAVRVSATPEDPLSGVNVYPYALLAGMMMSELSIHVEVVGLTQFDTATPNGPTDTSQAFQIFGSPPVQGATLDISAPELFAKRMTSFELTIDWFGLPVTTTGFKGYYKAYVVDADGRTVPSGSQYDNQSFLAGLQVCNPGWWGIASDGPPYYLFRTAERDPVPRPDGQLLPQTQLIASVDPETPEDYYDPALSLVRLTLTEPDTAFGNILYAPNVMAASVQLTAAASACAQQCGQGDSTAPQDKHLAPILAASAQAADGSLEQSLKAAAQRTLANLDGAAIQAIEQAIAAAGLTPPDKEALQESLAAALGDRPATLLQRLRSFWDSAPDPATMHANLAAWLAANSAAFPASASTALAQAQALIDAGSGISAVQARAAGRPAPVARPMVSAGVQDVRAKLATALGSDTADCIQKCMAGANPLGFPNQPWLPTASSISVNYGAETKLCTLASGDAGAQPPMTYFQLLPFGAITPICWGADPVPLLAPIGQAGALFIGLSDPVEQAAMLVQLAPPASGWPTLTPPVSWAQAGGPDGWTGLTPLRDTTNELHNSGIVSLSLGATADGSPPLLRIATSGDSAAFPNLAGIATNAASASWVGPGGGAALGTPLRAGTITKPESKLPDIGSIEQPLPSSGGTPAATGPAFEMWLAERLHHKDRGIQSWDYSMLALANFPSLWQVAVVSASNGSVARTPGSVLVVPIPGPESPAISDPTIPSSDSTMLDDIHAFLSSRISPFIDLTVANPVYRRIRVIADLVFTSEDTVTANEERLNGELIQYLSPWPSAIGPRPDDYYTRDEVAHFIRNRPYVRAILSLQLVPEHLGEPDGWHYLTSATSHVLKGKTQSANEPLLPRAISRAARA